MKNKLIIASLALTSSLTLSAQEITGTLHADQGTQKSTKKSTDNSQSIWEHVYMVAFG